MNKICQYEFNDKKLNKCNCEDRIQLEIVDLIYKIGDDRKNIEKYVRDNLLCIKENCKFITEVK